MNKEELLKVAENMVNAPSCCTELKEIGNKWIESKGENKEITEELKKSLRENITTIDELINLTASEKGKQIFGEDLSKQLNEKAIENKEQGKKYCFCDACKNAEILINNENMM